MNNGKRKTIVSISLPEDLNDILGDVCQSDGIPRSRIITLAVESFLRVRYPHMARLLEVKRNA